MLGSNSYAYGINNRGEVVGYWIQADGTRAFLYSGGGLTDLGSLGGTNHYALNINSSGQVVGFGENGTNGARAFLFSNGSLTNLGAMGGVNSYAYGINDGGQVAGYVDYTNGSRAYLFGTNGLSDLGTLGVQKQLQFWLEQFQSGGRSFADCRAIDQRFLLAGHGDE